MSEEQAAAESETQDPAEYARLELMGHRTRVGRIQEITRFGATLIQVDFYDHATGQEATELYAGAAIYCVSPVTKAVVDAYNEQQARYHAPKARQLPAPTEDDDDDRDGGEPDDPYDLHRNDLDDD